MKRKNALTGAFETAAFSKRFFLVFCAGIVTAVAGVMAAVVRADGYFDVDSAACRKENDACGSADQSGCGNKYCLFGRGMFFL